MAAVLIVGREWKFRALLRAELREEGYEALGVETLEAAERELATTAPRPAALVFDATQAPAGQLRGRLAALAARLPVLALTASDQRLGLTGVEEVRRPVGIKELAAAVKRLAPRRD